MGTLYLAYQARSENLQKQKGGTGMPNHSSFCFQPDKHNTKRQKKQNIIFSLPGISLVAYIHGYLNLRKLPYLILLTLLFAEGIYNFSGIIMF